MNKLIRDIVVMGKKAVTVTPYYQEVLNLFGEDLIAYLPLSEAAGSTTVLDIKGSYNGGVVSGVTLGSEGIGDGATAMACGGSSGYVNFFSSALAAALNGKSGSLLIWLKTDAWADTVIRRVIALFNGSTAANIIEIQSVGTGSIKIRYKADGVDKSRTAAMTETGWQLVSLSWNIATAEAKAYIGDSQSGSTFTSIGTLGDITVASIGSYGGGAYWKGGVGHAMLLNRPVTVEELTALKTVP